MTDDSPNIEKNMEPTKPINGSKSGTAAATPPIIKTSPVLSRICDMLCRSFGILTDNFRHKMSQGT